jgi:hypothetical protein
MNIPKIAALAVVVAACLVPSILRAADAAADAAAAAPATMPTTNPASRFYGPITAIDTTAKTFTVGDQTFCVTADSHLSKSDDSEGSLADAKVGEPARGTYVIAADGKLNVVKVRFGKKSGGKSGKKKGDAATTAPAAAQ